MFGIERFRECELIHGRWAMMACLGCIWAELQTGVSWVDAGKVELDGAQYFNLSLPFTITQLCWIEVRHIPHLSRSCLLIFLSSQWPPSLHALTNRRRSQNHVPDLLRADSLCYTSCAWHRR